MAELVSYDTDGRIATITMDDGKVNALSVPMLRELHAAIDQAERDGAAVILTGRDGYLTAIRAAIEREITIEQLTAARAAR